jgi:hypothetical protein
LLTLLEASDAYAQARNARLDLRLDGINQLATSHRTLKVEVLFNSKLLVEEEIEPPTRLLQLPFQLPDGGAAVDVRFTVMDGDRVIGKAKTYECRNITPGSIVKCSHRVSADDRVAAVSKSAADAVSMAAPERGISPSDLQTFASRQFDAEYRRRQGSGQTLSAEKP